MERFRVSALILIVRKIYRLEGKKEAKRRLREIEAAYGLGRGDLQWVLEFCEATGGVK